MKKKRISYKLEMWLRNKPLTPQEYRFLAGCLTFQKNHPQLTSLQWESLMRIKSKYKDG